ncbi:MAG TPA: biotin/lipoyl-containing protein [Candidatus Acidoferrales bacterium]|nr:biotin/lipoyl-containing protein [Candidatus Acidoferrales bacterium]
MKLALTMGGRARHIEIERSAGQWLFRVNGRKVAADIVEIQTGIYSLLIDGEAFEARIESGPSSLRVYVDGREYPVAIADPRRWRRNRNEVAEAEGHQQIVASMPGKLVRLMVRAGDTVEAGQGLLVVEAMKMQNEIKSPKAGKIERIAVREGQTVSAGDVLAVIV